MSGTTIYVTGTLKTSAEISSMPPKNKVTITFDLLNGFSPFFFSEKENF